jgi:hypothetical protein
LLSVIATIDCVYLAVVGYPLVLVRANRLFIDN